MEIKDIVSIYVGNFTSEVEFNNYIQEHFTEDGDIYSDLMKDLEVDFIDNQFQEAIFSTKGISNEELKKFSYSENFINLININFSIYNCIIMLYNFKSDTAPKKLI